MSSVKQFMSFNEFLSTQNIVVDSTGYIVNLALCASLVLVLAWLFIKFSSTIGNRNSFAKNLPLISLTTLIIITIVKSSLALSLGLVGALSIVRFRTAIKEPEELAYLFFSICIGLGLGANQRLVTLIGFGAICLFIIIRGILQKKNSIGDENLYLVFSHPDRQEVLLEDLSIILESKCTSLKLKRFDKSDSLLEVAYIAGFKNHESFKETIDLITKKDPKINFSVVDNSGLL